MVILEFWYGSNLNPVKVIVINIIFVIISKNYSFVPYWLLKLYCVAFLKTYLWSNFNRSLNILWVIPYSVELAQANRDVLLLARGLELLTRSV